MSNMRMILHVLKILGHSLSHHVICTVGEALKSNCNIAGTLDLSSYEIAKLSWRQNI